MASFFNLALDTTAPATVTASINDGDSTTASQDVFVRVTTADGDTTGYQVKIWGDVDTSANANIQGTEGASAWITFAARTNVRLLSGDGSKRLNVKVRDDVWNESSAASDTISLDSTVPVVTVSTGPDVSKVSKISGKRTSSFQFTADVDFDEYKVKVVPASSSPESAGTGILTTNGSTNMSGSGRTFPRATPISCAIDGRDLEVADSGDGTKIVKVFVRAVSNGTWSTA